MTKEAIQSLTDSQLADVTNWAQTEQDVRKEKCKQEAIARIRELAGSAGVEVVIGRRRGRLKRTPPGPNKSKKSGTSARTLVVGPVVCRREKDSIRIDRICAVSFIIIELNMASTIVFIILVILGSALLLSWGKNELGWTAGCILPIFLGAAFLVFGAYKAVVGDPDKPQNIVLAGRISDASQRRWLNNRLVLAYAQNEETARVRTQVAGFRKIIETPTDGVFTITLQNLYEVKASDIPNCKPVEFAQRTAFCWLGEIKEDAGGIELNFPAKKLQYGVRVLPGDYEALPEEMKEDGATGIEEGNIVIMSSRTKPPTWLDKVLRRVPAKPRPDSTPNLLESVEYSPRLEEVEVPAQAATASLNNCQGGETVRQTITDSKTFVREVTLQLSAGITVPVEVVELQLGAQGGYRQKQISTKSVRFELPAKAGSNVSYRIRWTEVWQKGVATVRGSKGFINVPFRLRKDLKSALDTRDLGCTAF
jgi:hypothetical protein